jgi:hypothetical protein
MTRPPGSFKLAEFIARGPCLACRSTDIQTSFVAQLCGIPKEIKHKNTLHRWLKPIPARTSLHSNAVIEDTNFLHARLGHRNRVKSCNAQWLVNTTSKPLHDKFVCRYRRPNLRNVAFPCAAIFSRTPIAVVEYSKKAGDRLRPPAFVLYSLPCLTGGHRRHLHRESRRRHPEIHRHGNPSLQRMPHDSRRQRH